MSETDATGDVRPGLPFTLELVAHCYHYDRTLCYFLSSLVLFPPADVRVTATIFYSPQDDPATVDVLAWFTERDPLPPHVFLNPWPIETPRLLRRAIGRNLACQASTADLIWLTDVDYFHGHGCIDAIPGAIAAHQNSPLFYPRISLRNESDTAGDAMIERVTGPGIYPIDATEFPSSEKNNRAIGGVQLVRGGVAREYGYLPDSRWQAPAESWSRTREDVHFRRALGTKGERIHLPNLYRIRHSKKGRDDSSVRN